MDGDTALEILRKQAIARAAALDPEFAKKVAEQEAELAEVRKRDDALQAAKQPKVLSSEEQSWVKMQDLLNNRSRI